MAHPHQEENPFEELPLPSSIEAQILELYGSSELLFQEGVQNSEAASSSNCGHEEQSSSYPTHDHDHDCDHFCNSMPNMYINSYNSVITDDNDVKPVTGVSFISPSMATITVNRAMFLEDQINNNLGIDHFSPALPFSSVPQTQYFTIESINSSHMDMNDLTNEVVVPPFLAGVEEECLHLSVPPSIHFRSTASNDYSPRTLGPYHHLSSSSGRSIGTTIIAANNEYNVGGIPTGNGLNFGPDFSHHQELEFLEDTAGLYLPADSQVFNCSTDDLQAVSSESQRLISPSTTLASEISSWEDHSTTFKVGKLSAEERKSKIDRYLKKRNERNFNKKIKYACRKTLADSRPRVRGRFAKSDEIAELYIASTETNYGSNHADEDHVSLQVPKGRIPNHNRQHEV